MMKCTNSKSVYIVLSRNDTFVGKLIRKRAELKFWNRYAGDGYSHVSLALNAKLDNMMSFARKKVNNPFVSGLIKEDIHLGVFARSGEKSCIAVIKLSVSESQYDAMQKLMLEYWKRRDELKYNFSGLFAMLLYGKGIKVENKYFCSQWVAEMLDESDIFHFENRRTCDVRPFDYYDVFEKNIVYEGLTIKYSEYANSEAKVGA